MSTQTVIREGVSVEKFVEESTATDSTFSHSWRCRLTIESEYDFPVAVRIIDTLPHGHSAPNVAIPSNESGHGLEIEAGSVSVSRFIEPGESVETTYVLLTDRLTEETLVGAPTIERVQPVDPATVEEVVGAPSWQGTNGATAASPEQTVSVESVRGGAAVEGLAPTNGHDEPAKNHGVDQGPSVEGSPSRMAISERVASASDVLVPRSSETAPVVSVVLPTMDEEQGVGECIDRATRALAEVGYTAEIIVSDSSQDRTPDIAAERGAHVVTPDQKGYGYAYRYAFERARGDYIVMGDADTTYDFGELPALFQRMQASDADMVMGSRLAGEIRPGAMPPLHQYVGNPLLTKFLNVFYDAGVTDAHSGFRVIKRDSLERLDLQSDGMEFASEMIMQAGERGFSIEEVPITYHERVGEATLDSFRDGWRHVRFMLVNAPDYLFTTPAIVFAVLGLVTMACSLLGVRLNGVQFGTYTMIAGSLFTILAFNIGSLALFSSIAGNPIREPRDPITRIINRRFQLEHAATIGLGLFAVGAVYAVYLVAGWVDSGFSELPLVPANLLAFTVIMLGVQTVFYAFFFSMLGTETSRARSGA
jgi:glycosyltransferase involved in cell wall biosynthesis